MQNQMSAATPAAASTIYITISITEAAPAATPSQALPAQQPRTTCAVFQESDPANVIALNLPSFMRDMPAGIEMRLRAMGMQRQMRTVFWPLVSKPAKGCLHVGLFEAEQAGRLGGKHALETPLIQDGPHRIEHIGPGKRADGRRDDGQRQPEGASTGEEAGKRKDELTAAALLGKLALVGLLEPSCHVVEVIADRCELVLLCMGYAEAEVAVCDAADAVAELREAALDPVVDEMAAKMVHKEEGDDRRSEDDEAGDQEGTLDSVPSDLCVGRKERDMVAALPVEAEARARCGDEHPIRIIERMCR